MLNINKMIAPGQKRPRVAWRQGVLQIWITRNCDLSCFNCTQGSNLRGNSGFITPEQFRIACESLEGYFGVVGMFGGNPAIHPQFDELCDIMQSTIPFEQRGLWCNNPLGHGRKMRETFNPQYSNLNVHLRQKAYDEFKRDWPESMPFGLKEDSRHSPIWVNPQLFSNYNKQSQESLIENCDINQTWSAMIGVFRGELRAWFCEIAGSQAINMQHVQDYPDTGLQVYPGWWREPIETFVDQINYHCYRCGVPYRGLQEKSQGQNLRGVETMTEDYASVLEPKTKGRAVRCVASEQELQSQSSNSVVKYIGGTNV